MKDDWPSHPLLASSRVPASLNVLAGTTLDAPRTMAALILALLQYLIEDSATREPRLEFDSRAR